MGAVATTKLRLKGKGYTHYIKSLTGFHYLQPELELEKYTDLKSYEVFIIGFSFIVLIILRFIGWLYKIYQI
jgi:hypothetical protein